MIIISSESISHVLNKFFKKSKIIIQCSLGTHNVTLAVNDVGGQTLGGAMLDKYIYGADVCQNFEEKSRRYSSLDCSFGL